MTTHEIKDGMGRPFRVSVAVSELSKREAKREWHVRNAAGGPVIGEGRTIKAALIDANRNLRR
jgi:hypothetical protein